MTKFFMCAECGCDFEEEHNACPFCVDHVESHIRLCGDCILAHDRFEERLGEEYTLLKVQDRIKLRSCFSVLRQYATMKHFKPGGAGYKRLREDNVGIFARRSERISARRDV